MARARSSSLWKVTSILLVQLFAIGSLVGSALIASSDRPPASVAVGPSAPLVAPNAACFSLQRPPRPMGPAPVSTRKPVPMVSKTGTEARRAFLSTISREALAIAIKSAQDRGWKRTDNFTLIESQRKPGVRTISTQDGDHDLANGQGRLLVWDWDTGDPDVAGGTIIVETYDPSTSTTFNFEFWAGDDWGYTRYTRFIEGRDREGHFTREASFSPEHGFVGLMKAGYQPNQCPERNAWKACMRECLKNRLNNAMWASVAGGLGSVRPCAALAGKAGIGGGFFIGAGVFLGCTLGGAAIAGGAALIYQFGTQPGCDSGANCGSQPSC